jgi:hypothetical protein
MIFSFLSSCNIIDKKNFFRLMSEIGVNDLTESVKYVIIIPGQGCSGCLQKAREFMKANHSNSRYLFILTKYDSHNQLKILYGKDVLANAIYDRDNVMFNSGFNSMFPAVVSVSSSQFVINLASPDNQKLWNAILVD